MRYACRSALRAEQLTPQQGPLPSPESIFPGEGGMPPAGGLGTVVHRSFTMALPPLPVAVAGSIALAHIDCPDPCIGESLEADGWGLRVDSCQRSLRLATVEKPESLPSCFCGYFESVFFRNPANLPMSDDRNGRLQREAEPGLHRHHLERCFSSPSLLTAVNGFGVVIPYLRLARV